MKNSIEVMKKIKAAYERANSKPHPRPTINKDSLEKTGISEEQFNRRFDNICTRWWDKCTSISDTVGGRLMTSTLASHANEPLILAMIADDIEAFKKHCNEDRDIFCLEFSGLCGAENIIKNCYLNDNEKKECLMLSENIIGYAISSGNFPLALILAQKLISLGKTNAGPVLLYSFEGDDGDNGCSEAILKMFKKNSSEVKSDADAPASKANIV
jgi:hypothetical protein